MASRSGTPPLEAVTWVCKEVALAHKEYPAGDLPLETGCSLENLAAAGHGSRGLHIFLQTGVLLLYNRPQARLRRQVRTMQRRGLGSKPFANVGQHGS